MKLRYVILENFRSYQDRTVIPISDLTAVVGQNDKGKSTIMEALEIFFNNKLVKIGQEDACKYGGADPAAVRIGCAFEIDAEPIILDDECETTFQAEELLNSHGLLEIHKVWNCKASKPTAKVTCKVYQSNPDMDEPLLTMTNPKLKAAARSAKLEVDKRKNPDLREALRRSCSVDPVEFDLDMSAGNCKSIFSEIVKYLPAFALFQSDRKSTDQDPEAQDPLKAAVSQALAGVSDDLEAIRKKVVSQVQEVASVTISKLEEMDKVLAEQLFARIDDPAWTKAFAVQLETSNGIPLNKRGSGVRRLVLLNFFRAQAELAAGGQPIIYAVEEPEAAQHPNNQSVIVEAFKSLVGSGTAQVLLTTHVPGVAGMLPAESIRYVVQDSEGRASVRSVLSTERNDEVDILEEIAGSLGVIPDNRLQVIVCVEGPHDVAFLTSLATRLREKYSDVPDLEKDPRVTCVPVGGSTLVEWVQSHYFREFKRPEFHLYDGEQEDESGVNVESLKEELEARGDGSRLYLLSRKAAENYLSDKVIKEVIGVQIEMGPNICIPTAVANAKAVADGREKAGSRLKKKYKSILNRKVAAAMKVVDWEESDSGGELLRYLREIGSMLR